MQLLSKCLFVAFTSLSFCNYAAGSTKIDGAILIKDTVDTYETGQNKLSRPYRISQLGRDVYESFKKEANYEALNDEIVRDGFIKDSWDEDVTISPLGENHEGFKVIVSKISEDSCKAHLEHAKNQEFFTSVIIYDLKGNLLDGCKKNTFWIFGKNNIVEFLYQ